jgi:hypothetical protein
MEEFFTPKTFASTFALGMVTKRERSITTPIDEMANLEIFTFYKQRK